MVKALPCPHVHAGSALVHQAEQAHPLHARSGGSGGIAASRERPGGQAQRRTSAPAGRACLSINKLHEPVRGL